MSFATFFLKEPPHVADVVIPTDPTSPPAVTTDLPPAHLVTAPSEDDAPLQQALDTIIDTWGAMFARRPLIHAGLVALKGFVDMTAPVIRSALAAAGLKIVRA